MGGAGETRKNTHLVPHPMLSLSTSLAVLHLPCSLLLFLVDLFNDSTITETPPSVHALTRTHIPHTYFLKKERARVTGSVFGHIVACEVCKNESKAATCLSCAVARDECSGTATSQLFFVVAVVFSRCLAAAPVSPSTPASTARVFGCGPVTDIHTPLFCFLY
jgi:hypothetical protein